MGEFGPSPAESNGADDSLNTEQERTFDQDASISVEESGKEPEPAEQSPHESPLKEVIERYDLTAADQNVLTQLGSLNSTHAFGTFHNFFNNHREDSQQVLEEMIAELETKPDPHTYINDLLQVSKLFHQIVESRGWHASQVIERQLEKLETIRE